MGRVHRMSPAQISNRRDVDLAKKRESSWRLNSVLYTLYVIFVLGTAVYTNYAELELHRMLARLWRVVAGAFLLCPLLLQYLREKTWKYHRLGEGMNGWVFRGICVLCTMGVLVFYFLGVNPGGLDGDPVTQLRQALSGEYNDLHPVLHTLLVFTLPMKLTGGWAPSIVLCQIVLFSAAMTFVCETVRKYADTLWAFLVLILNLANAFNQGMLMFPFKDETFGICAAVLVCLNVRILFSKGEWLRKPIHLVLFAVMLTLTSIVRHNGILFAVFCALGAFLCVPWKRGFAMFGVAALLFLFVKWPLYALLKVEYPETRSNQILGLPMSTLGGAVKYAPEKLDQETLDFAYAVAPKELWESDYIWGDFTWVEWKSPTSAEVMTQAGATGTVHYMLKAFQQAPRECLKALIRTTDVVYNIVPDKLPQGGVYINEYIHEVGPGLTYHGIPWIKDMMDQYRQISYTLFPHGFLHSGVSLLILMTLMLAKCPLNRKKSWLRIVPVLSVFAYNFGTMFMLTSWQDGARFFHYTLWVLPALTIILIHREPNQGDDDLSGLHSDEPEILPEQTAEPVSGR